MALINKRDLGSRISKAADSAPGIAQRIQHAQRLAAQHPIAEVPLMHTEATTSANISPERGGRFETVSIDQIDPNPHNARQIYRSERVSELATSIQAHGQDVPGIATVRNGRYILAAGHYRLRAIKVAGIHTMNLMVHDGLSDKDLYEFSYRENKEREADSALDDALCWRDLLTNGVYATDVELAESIGQSKANVSKTLRILDLPECVLDEIKKAPTNYAMSALYELALFAKVAPNEDAIVQLVLQLKDGNIGRREIQEARSRMETPRSRKQKETSRPYAIAREGAFAGSLKIFPDSGRVTFDVTFQNPADREEVLAIIKSKLGVLE